MTYMEFFWRGFGWRDPETRRPETALESVESMEQVPLEGWLQVLLVAGLIETQLFKERHRIFST